MMIATRQFTRRNSCPVCRSGESRQLLDLAFDSPPIDSYLKTFYDGRLDPAQLSGGRFVLSRCASCELVFQRDVPDDDFLSDLYGAIVRGSGSEGSRGLRVRQGYSFQIEQVLKHWNLPPEQVQILDFGAGAGDWLNMAAAYGCSTYAVELAPSRQAVLAGRGQTVLEIADLPAERFHFINTEQVFEHLVDPLTELRRLAGALRPGGLVRISVPNGTDVESRLAIADWAAPKGSPRSLNAVAPLEHINCFNHRSVVALGERVGLRRFDYSTRQYMDSWERARFIASAVAHRLKGPSGTLLLFQKH